MSHFEFSHGGTPACVPPAMADGVGDTRMAMHGRAPALLRRSGYAKAQRYSLRHRYSFSARGRRRRADRE